MMEMETQQLLVIQIFGMTLLSLIPFLSLPQLLKNPHPRLPLSLPLSLLQSQLLRSLLQNLSQLSRSQLQSLSQLLRSLLQSLSQLLKSLLQSLSQQSKRQLCLKSQHNQYLLVRPSLSYSLKMKSLLSLKFNQNNNLKHYNLPNSPVKLSLLPKLLKFLRKINKKLQLSLK